MRKIQFNMTYPLLLLLILFPGCSTDEGNQDPSPDYSYRIVDTGVKTFYGDDSVIPEPGPADDFYGQDAQYEGNQPSYSDNGDGTVTDNVTGLMWQQDMGEKMSWEEAISAASGLEFAGYNDWRVPTLKELYSLIDFNGQVKRTEAESVPFIDTEYFKQPFGDESAGERIIDAQTWSATEYVGTTMNGDATVFGVNFIDGRIKGYPKFNPRTGSDNKMYFRFVRGNTSYGKNNLVDNGDGTISDLSTGLMWQMADDGETRDWKSALAYAEDLELAGHTDWRLPDAKELQGIVNYTRAPAVSGSPALDPLFSATEIEDPESNPGHYGFYWTGTTHLDGQDPESGAVYVCFGEAQGYMNGRLMDVHGAGAQRSDPKSGNPDDYPSYWGPQGDVRYVYNFVRAVRNIE